MFSRITHVVACSSFQLGQIIFHVRLYHILFLHSSVDGYLGGYPFLAVTNHAATDIHVQVLWTQVSFLLGIHLGVKLLYQIISIWGTTKLFCNMGFYNPTGKVWAFHFTTCSPVQTVPVCICFFTHLTLYPFVSLPFVGMK